MSHGLHHLFGVRQAEDDVAPVQLNRLTPRALLNEARGGKALDAKLRRGRDRFLRYVHSFDYVQFAPMPEKYERAEIESPVIMSTGEAIHPGRELSGYEVSVLLGDLVTACDDIYLDETLREPLLAFWY